MQKQNYIMGEKEELYSLSIEIFSNFIIHNYYDKLDMYVKICFSSSDD